MPFAPGGVDVTARLIADRLTAALGQPFIVENRPGAGGSVGAKAVASAEPDGHTLMFSTPGPVVVSPVINRNAGYDAVKSFAPVAIVSQSPLLLVVHPSVPAKTVKDLVAYAKANPGKVHFPSPGFGTQPHLVGEMFKSLTGTRHRARSLSRFRARDHRPAGRTDADVFRQLRQRAPARRERQAARAGGHRRGAQPAIAGRRRPWIESGYGGIDATYWNGLLAPAGTPPAVVARLNAAVNQALAVAGGPRRAAEARFRPQDAERRRNSPPSSRPKSQRWGKVVRDANIKVE